MVIDKYTKVDRFVNSVLSNVIFNDKNFVTIQDNFLIDIDNNKDSARSFMDEIDNIRRDLVSDLDFYMESDPAIDSEDEVKIAYPGYRAIAFYRIAHVLKKLGYSLHARMISESAHTSTGIDIHPGADISSPFFIDHGTGIVIGETAIIGKNVKIYQGVTLGALSLAKGASLKGIKRHPTVGDNVTIYSGASILGDIKVGNNVTIGSNVFITEDVPDNVKVRIGKPELIFIKK